MAAGNSINLNTAGITGFTGTAFTGTPVTNHAIIIGGATSSTLTNLGPSATAGQFLQSGGAAADPVFSTATLPSTATGTGKVLVADGTNWVASTPTFPNASATSGKIIQSDGTNWIASTPTYPTTAGTSGKIHISDGTNIVSSTPTYPNTATGTGTLLRADGTNWVATTSTYPTTNAVSTLLYASGTNVMSALATANNGTFVTSATGVPSILAGPGTTGNLLQSNAAAAPSFSTATYPSTATGTGTLLRADGTNWVATTSTYPNTNAVSTLLYASSANVMAALATANSGVLTTDSSGVPSIDTTNFVRQTTGMQMKGNNANTAPPAGFIGEQIRATVASGSAVTVNNLTATNITSISLTTGIWDVSAVGVSGSGITTGTSAEFSISTSSATRGTSGDNAIQVLCVSTAGQDIGVGIPSYRITLSSTTSVYLVAFYSYSAGTGKGYGRISGTRVG
jgi:hypothetical protein